MYIHTMGLFKLRHKTDNIISITRITLLKRVDILQRKSKIVTHIRENLVS